MTLIQKVVKHYNPKYDGSEKIVCPFHSDGTPSLMLYLEQNTFHCFGCGAGTSAIDYVALSEGYDPKELSGEEFKQLRDKTMEIMEVSYDQYKEEKTKVSEGVVNVDSFPAMGDAEVKAFMGSGNKIIKGNKVAWFQGLMYRGIKDEYLKKYGHVTKKDDDGKVISRHYPESNMSGKIAGFKCRNHPKDFRYGNVGNTGGKNQLSGQMIFRGNHKYLLIVGGEEDKVAAYQMMEENRNGRAGIAEVHVVSPTCGENSAAMQVARNRDFCDRYEQIIIGMDNDEAGLKAAQAIAEVLPREKVKIATWSGKDPNKMLEDKQHMAFARDFYNARPLVSSGIMESSGLMAAVEEELMRPRITLPFEWTPIQQAMKGGIRQGSIVNIIGDTSVGKSTLVNWLAYFWMFNAPEKVGIASLEATAGQYTLDMISLHLEKNLLWMGEGANILEYIKRPEIEAEYADLLSNEYGQPRFSILDERDGDIKMLEKQIEKLVHIHGCKIIIVDVLTDILRGTSSDQQEDHMKWQKQLVKSGITIINVLHTRKPQASDGTWRKATEYDALGSSTFVQSAAYNIVISRNKMATCPIEKNTTHVDMPKCRGGETGEIMKLYYDVKTRTQVDLDRWLSGAANRATEQREVTPAVITPTPQPLQVDAPMEMPAHMLEQAPPADDTYNVLAMDEEYKLHTQSVEDEEPAPIVQQAQIQAEPEELSTELHTGDGCPF